MKLVDVKDAANNETVTKSLLVVPIKDREKLLKYYHYITGHKNYHVLHDKIISEGYYWNNLNESCKYYIKNCNICVCKNKNNFFPPPCNQILCDNPKELYVIDITDIPHELTNNYNEKLYLLSIIDHFSKFAYNYILTKKDQNTVMNKVKNFIDKYGVPEKILTDNGGEFINKKFKKYCKNNDIILIHGRPQHPQTQGAVERYNRTIKDLLKNLFIEKESNGEPFDLNTELKNAINIYNKTIHSTIGYSPESVFKSNDKLLFDKVKEKTKNSQKYKKSNNNSNIENRHGLICENFKLVGKTLKRAVFGSKGRYIIPIMIIKSKGSNEYIINISVNHKYLKKNKDYYAEYCLLKLCDKKTWDELIINWNNAHKN